MLSAYVKAAYPFSLLTADIAAYLQFHRLWLNFKQQVKIKVTRKMMWTI